MTIAQQSAKHLRDVFFGGNWTYSNVSDVLSGVDWQQANARHDSFNTITALTYHIGYFVTAILQVLRENKLEAHDKFSFDHPNITCEEDWIQMKNRIFEEVRLVAAEIEKMNDEQLFMDFQESKYGNYFRNIHGLIEHTHYHLGQISIIRKLQ